MTRPLALVFSAVFVLSSQAASAKPKVALTSIEGDSSGDVRDAVAEALEGKELSLIGSKEVNRAVDRLGDVAELTEKDFKRLANELEADAIVLGKLDRVGSSKTLKFRLYIHKKMARGFTVSFKSARSEKFRSMLHDKMIDKIGVAGGEGDEERPARQKRASEDEEDPLATKKDKKLTKKSRADDEDETRSSKKSKASEDDEARPSKKSKASEDDEARPSKKAKLAEDDEARQAKKAKAADEDGAAPSGDDKPARGADDEEAPRKAKKKVAAADEADEVETGVTVRVQPQRTANRFAVRLDAGLSVQQRTFKFKATDLPNKPKGAALSPVPGARFETELYPLAFSSPNGALAGLGIGIEYDKTLSLNIATSNEQNVAVPVKQSHYSIGARYRFAFGKTETSPTLTLGVGYGKRLFSPDSKVLTMDAAKTDIIRDTPSSNYTVIDPGVMFRFPVTRMVALSAGGRGMIIPKVGAIQNFYSYGRARVYGGEVLVALDVVLGNRVALRFAGELVQIGFAFTGEGELSNNLDGNTTTTDVAGLADRSIGGTATLAVMY